MTYAQKNWIKTIHVAKSKTGLSDDEYKALLQSCAGIDTSKDIKTWKQYDAIMNGFSKLGFVPLKVPAVSSKNNNPEWISEAQKRYIKGLWKLVATNKDEEALSKFIYRIAGVKNISWLKKKPASEVIVALRKMAVAQGINPDYKD